MKLTFFLIAIFLILLRLYFPRLELWYNGRGQGAMITKNGDKYIEGIWWSGKIRLSDDDRSIAEISPGGYLKFKENDTTMKAESDLQGKISYTLYDGHADLPLNDSGQQFIAAQIQKMIRFGFFGEERAERIYKKGGVPALLAELSRIRMEGGRDPYLNLLFKADTLTAPQLIGFLQVIDSSTNSSEEQHLLSLFSRAQLRDSAVAQEWLGAVGHLRASYMEKDLLQHFIDTGLAVDRFDTVLAITGRFGSPYDEQEVYKKLADLPGKTDEEWAGVIRAAGTLDDDYQKSDLLLRIAPKMPRNDSLVSAYRMSAKSIRGDYDYGRVMRAVE